MPKAQTLCSRKTCLKNWNRMEDTIPWKVRKLVMTMCVYKPCSGSTSHVVMTTLFFEIPCVCKHGSESILSGPWVLHGWPWPNCGEGSAGRSWRAGRAPPPLPVSLRLSPCAPSWLLRNHRLRLRTTNKGFVEAVDKYFDHLIATVVPLQVKPKDLFLLSYVCLGKRAVSGLFRE